MADLQLTEAERDRFWTYVDDGPEHWLWTGPVSKEGYGRFNAARRHPDGRPKKDALAAHRVSWWMFNGDPEGGVVQNACGDLLCVRPAHLRLTPGTKPVAIDGRAPVTITVSEHVCGTCGKPVERVAGRWGRICAACEEAARPKPVPRPRLLDLFCGGGGAGEGYRQAGFDVVGIDLIQRACGYPGGTFLQADALEVMADLDYLRTFDVIHASPPCQSHSVARHLAGDRGGWRTNLIPPTRDALQAAGMPFIIENVPGAPVRADVVLCGSAFPELHVYDHTGRRWLQRHRLFESNLALTGPGCAHEGAGVRPLGVYGARGDELPGGGEISADVSQAQQLMGAPWMSWAALVEAIPPAYTRLLGGQAIRLLAQRSFTQHSLTSV